MRYGGEVSGVVQRRRDFALEIAFDLFSKKAIEAVNMTDIADAAHMGVASLYRYFGTKQELVIQLSTWKWKEQTQRIDEKYEACNGDAMEPLQKLEFFMDYCIDLYCNYKDLLRFNANFQNYILHEAIAKSDLKPCGEGIDLFFEKIRCAWEEAKDQRLICEAFSGKESYLSVVCGMFFLAQSLAQSVTLPEESVIEYEQVLQNHKNMILKAIRA